jgi:toxin ParE1/3/4
VTRVIWAPQAIQDVEAIRAYVARDSVHYADLLVERIIAAVARLEDSPRSGRVVPELGDESVREVIHGNYRIVYRLRHDVVEIATVFHGARLFRLD